MHDNCAAHLWGGSSVTEGDLLFGYYWPDVSWWGIGRRPFPDDLDGWAGS